MDRHHAQMYRRLLESISHYSKKALAVLESGAGDLPQWTNDVISSVRTHMKDVTHFLRGQADHGVRYGGDAHGRAYMATKNLREISAYADECLGHVQAGAGHFPAWVENKISVSAEYMDLIGHWLENEYVEGRKYGTYLHPVPGDAGDTALYRGRADGIEGRHRNPYSPNDFQHKIYEQGFHEGLGRSYSGPRGGGGGGRGRGGAGGRRGGGGDRGGHGRRGPGGGPGMGRGRGRRKRHRRHGVHLYPYFTLPYYYDGYYEPTYLEPVIFPRIINVTARREGSVKTFYPEIADANGLIGLVGSGFEGIQGGRLRIIFQIGNSKPRERDAGIVKQSPNNLEIALPVDGDLLAQFGLLDLAYYRNDGELVSLGDQFFAIVPRPFVPFNSMSDGKTFSAVRPDDPPLVYQTGYGSMFPGRSPTIPGGLPPSRMVEPNRMGLHSRMLPVGTRFGGERRYGVPGIPAGQPGWAGQGGVAQMPHPTRRMATPTQRTFGPGLSAGQGGVQTFARGGPRAVETYGSLGYASMGDGSMDMAVRGARFGRAKSRKRRRRKSRSRGRRFAAMCPEGQFYDSIGSKCRKDCPEDTVWDAYLQRCKSGKTARPGGGPGRGSASDGAIVLRSTSHARPKRRRKIRRRRRRRR